ncbi:MAG: agmatine deiminase family protein [Thiothrix sp.]|uniref:agmatine deiminase family protein n=1 Tax=Thiothrix sp. TaxID=1032 RepID=UPI002616AEC7|nr:agmatine deiminase family protein [Thiothrix sp.]MDD5395394.1 agmatine deiminase family protein [Thiothrix sp.]
MNRRHFLSTSLLLSTGSIFGSPSMGWAASGKGWRMPDESEPHARTWMAFGASETIWGKKLLPEVRRNLITIATTIARYEPVSMLVREADYALAQKLLGSSAVKLVVAPLDDLWMRDTGAVFVTNAKGEKAAVNFNFNGWGEKQAFDEDANVAPLVAKTAGVPLLETDLVLEGGGIEVDGHGTAIITESCMLNANRNPGVSKAACEAELKRLLGLQKIIWLPGIKGKDITDGHTDFYARFARPGVVVAGYDPDPQSFDHAVTKRHLDILKTATDAQGNKLEVAVMTAPSKVREQYANNDFAAGYINFYVCNGAVIAPEFGDAKADKAAHDTLQKLFPDRDIVQIAIDGVAAGGGGIHCTTQQEPAV